MATFTGTANLMSADQVELQFRRQSASLPSPRSPSIPTSPRHRNSTSSLPADLLLEKLEPTEDQEPLPRRFSPSSLPLCSSPRKEYKRAHTKAWWIASSPAKRHNRRQCERQMQRFKFQFQTKNKDTKRDNDLSFREILDSFPLPPLDDGHQHERHGKYFSFSDEKKQLNIDIEKGNLDPWATTNSQSHQDKLRMRQELTVIFCLVILTFLAFTTHYLRLRGSAGTTMTKHVEGGKWLIWSQNPHGFEMASWNWKWVRVVRMFVDGREQLGWSGIGGFRAWYEGGGV